MCQSPLMYRIRSIGASGIPGALSDNAWCVEGWRRKLRAGEQGRAALGERHYREGTQACEPVRLAEFYSPVSGKRRREYEAAQRISNPLGAHRPQACVPARRLKK